MQFGSPHGDVFRTRVERERVLKSCSKSLGSSWCVSWKLEQDKALGLPRPAQAAFAARREHLRLAFLKVVILALAGAMEETARTFGEQMRLCLFPRIAAGPVHISH